MKFPALFLIVRRALFGPQWNCFADGQWQEITAASFSHEETWKANRFDRFMGVEDGQFFLSRGRFIPGFTKFGDTSTRPASAAPPSLDLPTP